MWNASPYTRDMSLDPEIFREYFGSSEERTSLLQTHEFGRDFLKNINHFVALQTILKTTQSQWQGCGSYLMDGKTLGYCELMFNKQCLLYDACKNSKHALEIGIHGGHSLLIMLLANPGIRITCIDICYWTHVSRCVDYLRSAFPDSQIAFHKGNSVSIFPEIKNTLIEEGLDFAHIDGAHEMSVIEKEIEITLQILRPGNYVLFDDIGIRGLRAAIEDKWGHAFEIVKIPESAYTNCLARIR